MSEALEPRLREHPTSRFEGDQHFFDLNQLADQLYAEARPATGGHRQIALYHYGSVTQVLFAFEAGGVLEEHKAPGVVTIQAIAGVLGVEAEGTVHRLENGQLLVLAPSVKHSVRAEEAARMLLTVHLHGDKHDDTPHRS